MEISDEVWVCQWLSPRELKIPSTDSEQEKMPAVVSLCRLATRTICFTASARNSGVSAAVWAKCRLGPARAARAPSPASGMGSRSGSGCWTLARVSDACTTRWRLSLSNLLVVARAVRPSNAVAHGDRVVFLRDILVDGVVGKAGQRELARHRSGLRPRRRWNASLSPRRFPRLCLWSAFCESPALSLQKTENEEGHPQFPL